jgi:CBS domain-containing protein
MTTDVATITVDNTVEDAVAKMRDGGFRHLPVVDASGEPFAMLSLRDLIALVTEAPLTDAAG